MFFIEFSLLLVVRPFANIKHPTLGVVSPIAFCMQAFILNFLLTWPSLKFGQPMVMRKINNMLYLCFSTFSYFSGV